MSKDQRNPSHDWSALEKKQSWGLKPSFKKRKKEIVEATETLYDEKKNSKEDWLLIMKEKESIDTLLGLLN